MEKELDLLKRKKKFIYKSEGDSVSLEEDQLELKVMEKEKRDWDDRDLV